VDGMDKTTKIRVLLESYLKQYVKNRGLIIVEGNTIHECLEDLYLQYPDFKEQLIDNKGRLKLMLSYQGTLINKDEGLNKGVSDGDAIHIFPISGGG
jgi:molybdopterin converting factor small subunit